MLIAQISDCHIVDPGEPFADRLDSGAGLSAAIETINALAIQPDLVVGTGDLVNDCSPSQYDRLVALLAALRPPFVPVPGNHDDRTELRRRFPSVLPAGDASQPLDFVVEGYAVRLVVLDTTIPGRHEGTLADAQLDWLDAQLGSSDRPTIVVQHHPPLSSGVGQMDQASGFDSGAREALVIERHRHVEAVVSGHLHRSFQRRYAGTIAITCPSTAGQLALELEDGATRYTSEPTGFLLHHWREGVGLTSHLVPIGSYESWLPAWAK